MTEAGKAAVAGALDGITVLELAEHVVGEYCGKLLAGFGATVIKIERPVTGSPTRHLGPFATGAGGVEASGLFGYLNNNKQSITLDLDQSDQRALLGLLLARSDVVLDDHAPGWLAAQGLGAERFEAEHSNRVLCAITPFGQTAEGHAAATDQTVFHASGWGYHTPSGAPPERAPLNAPGRFLASYEAGLDAAMCVCAAVLALEAGEGGRVIDVSMQAVLASRMDYVLAQMAAGDMPVGDSRHALDLGGPAGYFRCTDGYVYLWLSAPAHWEALGALLGQPAWMNDFPPRWLELDCTPERVALCRSELSQWLATQAKHTVSAEAQQLGITMVSVNQPADILACEQFAYRGFFSTLSHPVLGTAPYPGVPFKLSQTPARFERPAPSLGEHNA